MDAYKMGKLGAKLLKEMNKLDPKVRAGLYAGGLISTCKLLDMDPHDVITSVMARLEVEEEAR